MSFGCGLFMCCGPSALVLYILKTISVLLIGIVT